MGKEIESKFVCSAETFEAIKAAYPNASPIEMETTYYDTFDGKLNNLQWTLRTRLENGVSVCTLKTPGDKKNPDVRNEWELEGDNLMRAIPELVKMGAPIQLMELSISGLMQVCGAKFTRLAQKLEYEGTVVELGAVKSLPKNKVVIVSTGSQGENMSALHRMAFSTHKQVDIVGGDRIIISASAIPGNEKAVSRIINELYRKGAEVVYEKSEGLHVSGHACQEELKIVHGLVKPKFFLPVHGEQRHLQIHGKLATAMGMAPKNICIGEVGRAFELSSRTCKLGAAVPAGVVLVDGTGVGEVGSVVLRDRKHLAEDGMIVVCVNLSAEDGSVITGPDIITRGFIYVKESEELMDSLQEVAMEAIERCQRKRIRDWTAIKSAIKNDLSGYLYKTTKRNPMILPIIMEI